MPNGMVNKKEFVEPISDDEVLTLIEAVAKLGITKVRLTGGEPLVRPGIIQLIQGIAQQDEIEDISLTTNGILLEKMAPQLKAVGLKRLNISLDTLKRERYLEITGKDMLEQVVRGIEVARALEFDKIKINVVLQKGINDDEVEEFIALTKTHYEVRFIELMPIGSGISYAQKHYLSNEYILSSCPELIPCEKENISSPASYYQLPGAAYKVGLISPVSCSFCSNCNRIRVTADKKLKLCLHDKDEVDLRGYLGDVLKMQEVFLKVIGNKPKEHRLDEKVYNDVRGMSQIGG